MLTQENKKLRAVNKGQRDVLFGRSYKKQGKPAWSTEIAAEALSMEELSESAQLEAPMLEKSKVSDTPSPSIKRGGRPGLKGYGRRIPTLRASMRFLPSLESDFSTAHPNFYHSHHPD